MSQTKPPLKQFLRRMFGIQLGVAGLIFTVALLPALAYGISDGITTYTFIALALVIGGFFVVKPISRTGKLTYGVIFGAPAGLLFLFVTYMVLQR